MARKVEYPFSDQKTDIFYFYFSGGKIMKKIIALVLSLVMVGALAACGSSSSGTTTAAETTAAAAETTAAAAETTAAADVEKLEATEIVLDLAASLQPVFDEVIIPAYNALQPDVTITTNYAGSGKLLTGIEEANGIGHDIFFSAGKAQVKTLTETDNLVVDGSTVELLSNQLCLVKGNDTETACEGWETIADAKTMALCPGSVPVGKYSRIAFVALGVLEESDAPEDYTADEISEAFGGIEIDEADDVEVAAAKAVEGSVEIATIYYSDYYAHQDDLTIIAQDDGTLTGKIIYPVCQVANSEADEARVAATEDFLAFLQTDTCKDAFAEYCFIVNE